MKGLIIPLLFAFCIQKAAAQKDTLPFTSKEEQAKYNELNARRVKGIAFSNQTLNYSPRSWACLPYFDLDHLKHGTFFLQISALNLLFPVAASFHYPFSSKIHGKNYA